VLKTPLLGENGVIELSDLDALKVEALALRAANDDINGSVAIDAPRLQRKFRRDSDIIFPF
jgi:hypothetical protein